jgi:hypothetical protein
MKTYKNLTQDGPEARQTEAQKPHSKCERREGGIILQRDKTSSDINISHWKELSNEMK